MSVFLLLLLLFFNANQIFHNNNKYYHVNFVNLSERTRGLMFVQADFVMLGYEMHVNNMKIKQTYD